jgi:cytochrome c oxidase cbb3-type subunit 3
MTRRWVTAALARGALVSSCFVLPSLFGCEGRDPTPVGRGARIFQRTCSGCHGADGKGSWRAGLMTRPRDLTKPEFQAQMTNDQLRHSIRVGKGQMPAFGGLMGDEEISDVIAFVRTLVPPGSLPPGLVAPPSAAPPAVPHGAAPSTGAAPAAPPAVSPPTAQGAAAQ